MMQNKDSVIEQLHDAELLVLEESVCDQTYG